jgi:hypothetical protein
MKLSRIKLAAFSVFFVLGVTGFSFVAKSGGDADLTVTKSNDAGGAVLVGATFKWTLSISNFGDDDARFFANEVILRDQLPAGPIYGLPVAGNFNGVFGSANIQCSIDVNNLLSCIANPVEFRINDFGGSFDIQIDVTPVEGGTLTNPTGGVCQVDPDNVEPEDSELNNNCNSDEVTVTAAANLTATKTNGVGGVLTLPQTFQWTIKISNVQTPDAEFQNGQRILVDNLPNGNTMYGTPTVQNDVDITNVNNIDCVITSNVLTCTANGGTVMIVGPTGMFEVTFSVMPMGTGTLTNPTGGLCRVDPDDHFSEGNEVDNDCNNLVNAVSPLNMLPAPVNINLTSSFNVPFWCGERKDVFTMDGVEFTNLEVFETEIEIILPQRRILLIFPGPAVTANLVETATITHPSNFLTPGDMSIPFRVQLQSGKTIRKNCAGLKVFPTRLDGGGDVDQVLGNLLAGVEFFHGVFTLETDSRDLRVYVNKITRSWKCVDEGGGLDCFEGEMDMARKEISPVRINIRRTISHEVPQPPIASMPASTTTSFSLRELDVTANSLAAGRAIDFRAQRITALEIEVEVYSLNGKKIYSKTARGNSLHWNLRDEMGWLIANGVYLYVVSTRDAYGKFVRSGIKKLVVLR